MYIFFYLLSVFNALYASPCVAHVEIITDFNLPSEFLAANSCKKWSDYFKPCEDKYFKRSAKYMVTSVIGKKWEVLYFAQGMNADTASLFKDDMIGRHTALIDKRSWSMIEKYSTRTAFLSLQHINGLWRGPAAKIIHNMYTSYGW